MKRRVLAMFLVLVLIFSMMPTTALAKEVDANTQIDQLEVGDTFWAADENATLPVLPDSTWSWVGPEQYLVCSLTEHEHRTGNRNSCYTDNCERRNHEHCYEDSCTNTEEGHEHCYTLTCGYAAHAHSDECYKGYVWTIGGPTTSTISFKIVNGTWSGLSLGDDAYLSDDGTTVTFTVTVWEPYGYVYKCGGTMETFLSAILGNDNSMGSAYIVPDEGYTLDGMSSQDWDVESGGITGSGASANEQMDEIKDNIHDYDDNRTPEGGFAANTVYVLTLTKSSYSYTGAIDKGGTVTNASQTGLAYESTSQAMVFTPAEDYEIVGVTVSVNKGTAVSYAEYAGSGYTLAADGSFTFPAETVIHDIDVVVTTALKTYTVTWVDGSGNVLETDTGVVHGSTPSYDGNTPVKASDDAYNYAFAGWDVIDPDDGDAQVDTSYAPVTQDVTYQAIFTNSARHYTVMWLNHNKTELETDQSVPYGTTVDFSGADQGTNYANCVSYGGDTPTKAADSSYTYKFIGWAVFVDGKESYTRADLVSTDTVAGDETYIAVFEGEVIPIVATVEVILDDEFIANTHVAGTGSYESITTMEGISDDHIYLSTDGTNFVTLTATSTGVYQSESDEAIPNGTYHIYINNGSGKEQIGTNTVVINNADGRAYLPYYSVSYEDGVADEMIAVPATEYYYIGSHVDVSTLVPQRDGYNFLYWDESGTRYDPSTALETVHLDSSITQAHTLVAQWESAVQVDVTVVVNHLNRDIDNVNETLNIHLTSGTEGIYNEVTGTLVSVNAPAWLTSPVTDDVTGDVTTTFEAGTLYTGLSAALEYAAHATIDGYVYDTGRTGGYIDVESEGDTYEVTLYLIYDPDGFELEFDVVVDPTTPYGLVPEAVDVKVTYWDGGSWKPIAEHIYDSVEVVIDQDTLSGTGKVHVWGFDGTTPYLYRIEVVRIDLGNYQLPMSEDTAEVLYYSTESGFFPAKAYRAKVTVGSECDSGLSEDKGLYGSHAYNNNGTLEQHDDITAYISVTPYYIDLMMNDDTEAKFADINDRFTVPSLAGYVPSRTGYTFDGWYTADGTDGDWGTPISGGEYIKDHVDTLGGTLVLYAKWKEDLTVKGRVVVDLGYPCDDTSRTVTVELQWKPVGGTYFVTEDTATVKLIAEAGKTYAISEEYVFSDLPNTGTYHIHVAVPAGGTIAYRNETDGLYATGTESDEQLEVLLDYSKYDADSYVVVDSDGDNVAYVNIYMDATEFVLGYQVDASAVGAGYRPSDIRLALCHDHNGDKYYHVIKKLDAIQMDNSAGSSGVTDIKKVSVPPYHANGKLYNYVISTVTYDLKGETFGGDDRDDHAHHHYTSDLSKQKDEAPFAIRYTGPANYKQGGLDGYDQDVILKAIIEPNTYSISYDTNGGHWDSSATLVTAHKWSFDTNLGNPQPVLDGFVFVGWTVTETLSGKAVTLERDSDDSYIVPGEIWEDITLTAIWEKDTVEEPDDPDPKPGDGIPDKYQVEVRYVATAGGSVDPTYDVITLRNDKGELVEELASASAISSTATADNDYVFDGWTDSHSNASYARGEKVTGTVTISNVKGGEVYTFTANFAEDKKGDPEKGGDGTADKYQVFVEFYSAGNGTVEGKGIYQTFTFETAGTTSGDVTPSLKEVTVAPDSGYAFDVWTKDTVARDNTPVNPEATLYNVPGGTTIKFYAHFAKDELEDPGKDPDPNKPGDGIPDKYQATVTYKVVSGYWEDSSNTDKLAVFTLYEKHASGAWVRVMPLPTLGNTIPSGMKPDEAHTGAGQWDEDIDSATVVMGNATYIYTFGTAVAPAVDVGKTADRSTACAGDTIKWTVTVRNAGNTDLSDISLTDTLYADGVAIGSLKLSDADGNVVTAIPELKVGQSVTLYASYVVQAADLGKTIKNVATAAAPGDGPSDAGESGGTDIIVPYVPPVEPSGPALNREDHVAYIIGYPDGTVQPQGNITRAEVATIFFRLLTDASRAEYWSQSNPYSDVSIDKWYNNAISTLSNADIITGYPDGSFRPNAPITRAEFAAIAARFSEVIYNGGNSFTDVPENHWAARYIALAEHLGWVNGYPDGSFKPDQAITRAEAMTLINRVLEREVEEEHLLPDMVVWVDNLPGTWYYEAVQEATNSHTYVRLSKVVPGHSFCYEDWIEILPVPDWAALEKAWSDANDHR